MNNILIQYSIDTENPQNNYDLATWYEVRGHTAAAHSFYLRCAELSTDNPLLAYKALVRASLCYKSQGSRDATAKVLLENALVLVPKYPQAYYLLSLLYEKRQDWQNCYIYATLGLELSYINTELEEVPEYSGEHLLLFQKAVSGWWWGKARESQKLFQHLVDNFWTKLEPSHKHLIQVNILKIGSGPESNSFRFYTKDIHDRLRFKFAGSDTIDRNYSQVYQDMFTLAVLQGKRNGTFLEIGAYNAFRGNNTALLEQSFDWKGVALEINPQPAADYALHRSSKILVQDALTTDYTTLLAENFDSTTIDYLQVDIEPPVNTYECLTKIPFDKYKFRVITFEHDHYTDVDRIYRRKSRKFLVSKGYILLVGNVSPDDTCIMEDWWVHPDLVDKEIIDHMRETSKEVVKIEDYMLMPKK